MGVIAALLLVTALVVPLFAALAVGQGVRNAADAAALAAADTASGAVAGVPCGSASATAALNGASVRVCAVDGLIASVTVGRAFLIFELRASARAGPPGPVSPAP